MSVIARVVRQFIEGAEPVPLERVLALPFQPTMGTRLDLRELGVESALEVIGLTVRPLPTGPGIRLSDCDVFLSFEPLDTVTLAREGRLAGFRAGVGARAAHPGAGEVGEVTLTPDTS